MIVRALQERDGNQCFYCDEELSPYRTHIDHVVPTVNRGPDALDNLVLACQRCNIVKRQRPGWFFVITEAFWHYPTSRQPWATKAEAARVYRARKVAA